MCNLVFVGFFTRGWRAAEPCAIRGLGFIVVRSRWSADPRRGALPEMGPAGVHYRRRLGHVGSSSRLPLRRLSPARLLQLDRDPNMEKPPLAGAGLPGTPQEAHRHASPRFRRKTSRSQTSTVSFLPTRKRRVASSVAHQATSAGLTVDTYASHCEDTASRGLCSAYIACASKTRQPRIRDPRLLKTSS